MTSFRSSSLCVLVYDSLMLIILLMMWGKGLCSFVFVCRYQILPVTIYWKSYPFSSKFPWHLGQKSIDHKCKSLFQNFILFFSSILFIFRLNPHCIYYCSFMVCFEIKQKYSIFFLLKDVLATLDPLYSLITSRIGLPFLQKRRASEIFVKECTESVD